MISPLSKFESEIVTDIYWKCNKRLSIVCSYNNYSICFQVDNKSSLLVEECSSSVDEIAKSLGLLEVNDSLFSPNEDSISSLSTQKDEPIPHSNAKHEKVNEFLVSWGIEPLERRWLKWTMLYWASYRLYLLTTQGSFGKNWYLIPLLYARNLDLESTCYHLWKRVTWRHSLNHTTMPTAGRPEDKSCPSCLA